MYFLTYKILTEIVFGVLWGVGGGDATIPFTPSFRVGGSDPRVPELLQALDDSKGDGAIISTSASELSESLPTGSFVGEGAAVTRPPVFEHLVFVSDSKRHSSLVSQPLVSATFVSVEPTTTGLDLELEMDWNGKTAAAIKCNKAFID